MFLFGIKKKEDIDDCLGYVETKKEKYQTEIYKKLENKIPGFMKSKNFIDDLEKEKLRSDRNNINITLLVLDISNKNTDIDTKAHYKTLLHLATLVNEHSRKSDNKGWYETKNGLKIGFLLYDTAYEKSKYVVKKLKNLFDNNIGKQHPSLRMQCDIFSYPNKNKDGVNFTDVDMLSDSGLENKSGAFLKTMEKPFPLWKRMLDIVGSVVGITLLSPLFLMITAFIKLVSPGPALFTQKRVGYLGKTFTVLKFRTMDVNIDTSKHQKYFAGLINDTGKTMNKLDNNPDIIPFGNFLRKTCLDELPQLFNVFKGEMSLVGPRPPIPYEVQEYNSWHTNRFCAMPGMTGLWQVSGKNRLTFKEMMCLDIKYDRNKSLLFDLKILLMTLPSIVLQIYYHMIPLKSTPEVSVFETELSGLESEVEMGL